MIPSRRPSLRPARPGAFALAFLSVVWSVGCNRASDDSANASNTSASSDLPAGSCCDPGITRSTTSEAASSTSTTAAPQFATDASSVVAATMEPASPAPASSTPFAPEPIQLSPDPSIHETLIGSKPDLDALFVNQDGQSVNLADYHGKTLVISSIFTSCPTPTMCPRLTADIARLAAAIPFDLHDRVRFVVISFDPERDSPAAMRAFAEARGIDFSSTDFLTGDVDSIRKVLVTGLDVPIEIDPATNKIAGHVLMVHVINADGYIVVERTAGTSAAFDLLKTEIVRAATLPFDPATGDPPSPEAPPSSTGDR